jgi:hypothetical protein
MGSKYVAWTALVLVLSSCVVALANLPLFQDGASYLFELMVSGSAIRHGRLGAYLVQAPSIVSRKAFTVMHLDAFTRLAAERLVFCLNYALVPLAVILLSWSIVRKTDERLFLWSALIVLMVNLVNFSWVSELLIAVQLGCPLTLACCLHPRRPSLRLLALVLGAFVFSLHALSFLIFLAVAIGSFAAGRGRGPERRPLFVTGCLLVAAAILRAVVSLWHLNDYERSMVQPDNMYEYLFVTPAENILFVLCAVAIGLNRLRQTRMPWGLATDVGLVGVGCIVLVSAYFAGEQGFPLKAGAVLFASLILIVCAGIDSRNRAAEAECRHRFRLVFALSLCFLAVTVTKAAVWHAQLATLEQILVSTGTQCVERSHGDLAWLDRRPGNIVDTWALPSLIAVRQVGDPARYLLAAGDCEAFRRTGEARIDPWTILGPRDLQPFAARTKHQR